MVVQKCPLFVKYYKYSRVQKSWNEIFFKILKKPSIVQKKMIPHIKGLDFPQRWSKKKIQAQKQTKNVFFVFSGCFWAYVWQPHDHKGWVTLMLFVSINSTNPRTNPWKFHEKILRIGGAGKWVFFEAAILNFLSRPFWNFFGPSYFDLALVLNIFCEIFMDWSLG